MFRQGDIGFYWYAVLSGSLDVKVSKTGKYEVWIKLHVRFSFKEEVTSALARFHAGLIS